MRRARVLLLCGSCALPSLASAQAVHPSATAESNFVRAESEARRTTMARALFDEGLRYLDAGRWFDAQDRFARVVELRYSPVAVYNLGLAQARLGHGVVAAATLRKLLADPSVEAKVREPAAALLIEVEAKFGWLGLRVAGPCEGCRVYVDSEEWPPAVLGVSVPIDAGTHALELRWDTAQLATDSVEVAAGARVAATLTSRPGALEVAQARSAFVSQTAARDPAGSGRDVPRASTDLLTNPWFWGAMGVLAAGVVTTLVIETR